MTMILFPSDADWDSQELMTKINQELSRYPLVPISMRDVAYGRIGIGSYEPAVPNLLPYRDLNSLANDLRYPFSISDHIISKAT